MLFSSLDFNCLGRDTMSSGMRGVLFLFERWRNWVIEQSIGMAKVTQWICRRPGPALTPSDSQSCSIAREKPPLLEVPRGFISMAAFPHAQSPHPTIAAGNHAASRVSSLTRSWRNTPNYCGCVLHDCNVSWHFQAVSFFEKGISTRRVERLIFQTWKLSFAPLGVGEAWTRCLVGDWRSPPGHVRLLSLWRPVAETCTCACTSTHTHTHTLH